MKEDRAANQRSAFSLSLTLALNISNGFGLSNLPFTISNAFTKTIQLARALIEYDLAEDGGVEEHVAHGLEYLQFHCFSKMSRFSKFCKFLSETGEGLKLVAFFVAAQHLFVAYYEGDPDFAVYMGELR